MSDSDEWADQVRDNRAEKDRFFREHRQSPLPPERREGFDGLAYFEPDSDYRIDATVSVHDDPETVELEVTNGPPTRYRRVVTFGFELDGETRELDGFRQDTGESGLFVPFRDKTTGQETYEGGRYLELDVDGELADGDAVTLDFNLAFTPFCAFNDAFACPLPPEDNWLETTVEAGERAP